MGGVSKASSIDHVRFDNEYDRSPAAEKMYLQELREFQTYLVETTDVAELKLLNLLGAQFALYAA